LKLHVEAMLHVYPDLGTFLESPAVDWRSPATPPVRAGRFQLGPELARGGMGVVYWALAALLAEHLPRRPRRTLPAAWGIVTAADRGHFCGFQVLYTSLVRGHDIGVLLVDIGLTEAQRAWALRQPGLTLYRFPPEQLVVSTREDYWQAWNKPFFVAACPFRRALWLDTDCLVRDDLAPVFRHLEARPFITSHRPEWINCNGPVVADALPAVRGAREDFTACTGVFAFDLERDWYIVNEWMALTRLAVEHPWDLAGQFSFWDEGVFRAVVQTLGMYDECVPDLRWNRTIDPAVESLEAFLSVMEETHGQDCVLHFCGRPKYWEGWGVDMVDLDPHAGL
jgi:hypothetical protein